MATFKASENIIVGNTSFYGATSGKAFINGKAGERFCVRNSGATAVVEGVGDHGCEYMTGGRMVCIGQTGRNFAAGMSGGFAYVFDETEDFKSRCNMGMVELEGLETEDESFLQEILAEHVRYTQSTKAEQILKDFDSLKRHFVKVVPVEYRRVLKERAEAAQAKAKGLNVIQPQPGAVN